MRPLVASVFVMLALLVLAPTAAAAPFLQAQVDAGRTGASADPGPSPNILGHEIDVAFSADVPGMRAYAAPPLILNGTVYVLTGLPGPMFGQDASNDPGAYAIHAIDLDTAERTELVAFDEPPTAFASDGEQLFVATQQGIEAYSLDGQEVDRTWPFPPVAGGEVGGTVCAPLAVHEAHLYASCSRFAGAGTGDSASSAMDTFVVSLSTALEEEWLWTLEDRVDTPSTATDAYQSLSSAPAYEVKRLAVAGPTVAISLIDADRYDTHPPVWAWTMVFDRASGEFLWQDEESTPEYANPDNVLPPVAHMAAPGLLGTGDTLYIKGQTLDAREPEGPTKWVRNDLGGLDTTLTSFPAQWLGNRMGLVGDTLLFTHNIALLGVESTDGATVWGPQTQGPGGTAAYDDADGILVAGDVGYVTTYGNSLVAFDPSSGEILAFHELMGCPFLCNNNPDEATEDGPFDGRVRLGVGDGVLVAAAWDGTVTVLGRTDASIQPTLTVDDTYPEPTQTVRVDLAGTTPGALDPGLEFKAIWGDGTIDGWQNASAFEHAYDAPGRQEAVFRVRNAAGQTSSVAALFDVGGTAPAPPPERTLLERAFDRENQDLTFGVLGILVAVGGGVFAFARARTRRSRLQRELAAIEQAYESNRERPTDCEAALAERRAHVQGLALDGALDEGHVALLERRIEELRRQLRLGALDERFQFLPYGMVVRLREMLDDGHISAWEREHVLRALDEDDVLTKNQKGKVRDLVDSWFQRDAGETA